jgi:hypothetical protein
MHAIFVGCVFIALIASASSAYLFPGITVTTQGASYAITIPTTATVGDDYYACFSIAKGSWLRSSSTGNVNFKIEVPAAQTGFTVDAKSTCSVAGTSPDFIIHGTDDYCMTCAKLTVNTAPSADAAITITLTDTPETVELDLDKYDATSFSASSGQTCTLSTTGTAPTAPAVSAATGITESAVSDECTIQTMHPIYYTTEDPNALYITGGQQRAFTSSATSRVMFCGCTAQSNAPHIMYKRFASPFVTTDTWIASTQPQGKKMTVVEYEYLITLTGHTTTSMSK